MIDRSGAPGGPLAIALHGAVGNRKLWLPLARALPPAYELWCPDLPGHGARGREPFALATSLALVGDLLAAAAPRRAVLAGDSLGGYLALAAAHRFPNVAAVVAGGCTWSMSGVGGRLARASDLPPRLLERLLGGERTARVAAALVARATDAVTARAIVAAGLRPAARSESLRALAGLDLVSLVRSLDVPIVFVNGAWDWPTRAGERALVRAARSATLRVSRRSGHGVGFFDAPFFARAIEAAAQM